MMCCFHYHERIGFFVVVLYVNKTRALYQPAKWQKNNILNKKTKKKLFNNRAVPVKGQYGEEEEKKNNFLALMKPQLSCLRIYNMKKKKKRIATKNNNKFHRFTKWLRGFFFFFFATFLSFSLTNCQKNFYSTDRPIVHHLSII